MLYVSYQQILDSESYIIREICAHYTYILEYLNRGSLMSELAFKNLFASIADFILSHYPFMYELYQRNNIGCVHVTVKKV